jgi:5-methylthioadenosine/S-adenosylhomocysteine deaminase
MDTAAKLHKVIANDPTVVSAREALAMGTIGGARAVHMEDRIGSLEIGKLADLIIVDMDATHLVPRYDIYSHLVYAVKASDVTDTIVNGRVLMRNRQLLTVDAEKARDAARRYARRIARNLGLENR